MVAADGSQNIKNSRKGGVVMQYVAIKEDQGVVACPICGRIIDLSDVETTACEHLDVEGYITPRGPFESGYDVWFRQ